MMKRFRLRDNHPLQARLGRVWDAFEKEGIRIDMQRDGTFIVKDNRSDEFYEMTDSDDGGLVGHLPPVFEYKLTFEKEVKE